MSCPERRRPIDRLLSRRRGGDDKRGRTALHPRVTPADIAVDFAALARLD
jgi:hypothetical protein